MREPANATKSSARNRWSCDSSQKGRRARWRSRCARPGTISSSPPASFTGRTSSHAATRSRELTYCIDPAIDPEQRYNIVNIELRSSARPRDLARFERHFTMSSSCGVCGRAQLDSLRELGAAPIEDALRLEARLLYGLPERMRKAQRVFAATGGLHAAALFDVNGETIAVREDIGRHNAVDKLVGWALLNAHLPLRNRALVVSGRASYEILQKAVMARVPIVASVSAPSSLAVELAREFNITLAGFVRDDRANLYAAPERVVAA